MQIFKEIKSMKKNPFKHVLAIVFCVFLFTAFFKSGSSAQILTMAQSLRDTNDKDDDPVSFEEIDSAFTENIWKQKELIDLNGSMAKELGMRGFYGDIGIYVTDDQYIVSPYPQTSTDYEVAETVGLKSFLDSNNIHFLYVNEPTKYTDDSFFLDQFGVESYSNRNADLFLKRIREAGVPCVDLREYAKREFEDVSSLFYRTDHHWTVPAGLWATRIIADSLNRFCGYRINLKTYDDRHFTFREWKNCWLGEQGRKVAASYVGLDDFTEIKPNFVTDYTFKANDGSNWNGSFDGFVNEDVYDTEKNVYENQSWHYSYDLIDVINNRCKRGKILLLCDSFDHVMEPFLSLGVHEIDALILRDQDDDFDLREFILANGYDTVLVTYAQFMIGAHDDAESANYHMFRFIEEV